MTGLILQESGAGARTRSLPIFIVGMPRSGSTLVEQIISSHPQVFGAGELGEVPLYIAAFVVEANPEPLSSPVLPVAARPRIWRRTICKRMANLGKGAARVTIKTLQNYMHLGVIATLFPPRASSTAGGTPSMSACPATSRISKTSISRHPWKTSASTTAPMRSSWRTGRGSCRWKSTR